MPGQPVNVEIPADNTAQARQFWGSLFGWKFEASAGQFEYDVAQISEHSGAAVTDMEPGKRGLRIYFDVDDINVSAGRVRELGGSSGEPRPVPHRGWFSVCKDTEGNEFALWQDDPAAPGPTY
jgi:uncharacterized protein